MTSLFGRMSQLSLKYLEDQCGEITMRDAPIVLRHRVVIAVAAISLARDDPATAVKALRRGVRADPFLERMQRQLVEALLRLGRRSEASEQLGRCIDALRNGLDAEPEPETLALRGAPAALGP